MSRARSDSRFRSIQTKLVLIYVLTVVVTLSTAYFVHVDSSTRDQRNQLISHLDELAVVQSAALAIPVWELNDTAIAVQLAVLESHPDVLRAAVVDTTGEIIASVGAPDQEVSDSRLAVRQPIFLQTREVSATVGHLELAFHDGRIRESLFEALKSDALTAIALGVVLVVVTVLASQRIVVSPLRKLVDSIEAWKSRDELVPVDWDSSDEIGRLVKDFNEMQAKEISAKRELARQSAILNTVIENTSEGITLIDAQCRLTLFNAVFEEMMEFPTGRLRPGDEFEDFLRHRAHEGEFGEEDAELAVAQRMALIENGEPYQITHTRPNGEVIDIRSKPLVGGGVVETYINVTQLHEFQQDLRSAMEQAEAANRSKSEFLAHMSHELRTPLNSIIAFSEIMSHGMFGRLGDARYEEYANDIHQSGRHLLSVINDILDISKIEAGQLHLDESDMRLSSVIHFCTDMLATRLSAKSISLVIDVSPNLPVLRGDERLIKQVMLNLLSNAVKFTGDGGQIRLIAHADRAGVWISVSDTGVGIPPEDVDTVMEPFRQVRRGAHLAHDGTGLGLSISKRLMEMHSGDLTLESEVGAGTTVTMFFPRERVVDGDAPETAAESTRASLA